jgi:hypothetical protein
MARPGGARPQPAGARPAPSRMSTGNRSSISRQSLDTSASMGSQNGAVTQSEVAGSISSRYSMASSRGRDYYPSSSVPPINPSEVVPSSTYIERGQRWMEKEEACSLRDAMEELDLRRAPAKSPAAIGESQADSEVDARLYDAALNEAAELVWQHQNPTKKPEPDAPYRYRPHLRKNSYAHARAANSGKYGDGIAASGLARDSGSRSVSASSSESDGHSRRSRPSVEISRESDPTAKPSKPYGSVGSRPTDSRRRSSMKRNISGEVERPFSGDQIWEEPESANEDTIVETDTKGRDMLASRPHNPLSRVRFQTSREPVGTPNSLDKIEIYRNPPTQSRNAQYTTNNGAPLQEADEQIETKDGKEIRSEDIRSATSMKLRDRSPRLPEPTAVSNSPGRPIVSFDANWRAPDKSTDVSLDQREASPEDRDQSRLVGVPSISVSEVPPAQPRTSSGPGIPSISIGVDDGTSTGPVDIPIIAIDEPGSNSGMPMIVTPDGNSGRSAAPRALPTPGARPLRAQRPRGHWSPAPGSANRRTTLCHECGFPIEGRFVGLAGSTERFHPQCLACYTCGTSLEAMEISPEPQQIRRERLERIHRRATGEVLEETPGMTQAEDGDERLRLFCHLDWHEHFAPRCKHCTTPILGEHIVALGQHWHYGHFFCAECGDPFQQGMTHIEKDGYAWCVSCQTKRTERRAPKCKKCGTAVVGQYIQALGGEWHEHCFRCADCQGGFDDGQIFPKDVPGGTIVLCTSCRAKELKR